MDKNRYFQIRSGKYIKTKVADIQRFYSKWLWLVMAVYKPSFADAKILKYIPKHHVVCHFAGYIGDVEDALADVLREEVA